MPAASHDDLPEDAAALRALLREQALRAEGEKRRADGLEMELLRLRLQLEWFKKRCYGPRADRLRLEDLPQLLLEFGEELERKPVNPDDVPPPAAPEKELRWVRKRRGRRNLASFDHLPVTTKVYELSPAERACPGCGAERAEIGCDTRWQVEYTPAQFERIEHIRKKYACAGCELRAEGARIEVAAKPAAAIERGLAGPGLLAYIVTSKFSDFLPLYRLENIFERQGFAIARATQSVWCGDVADVAEPLYRLMAERVRASHLVASDDTVMPMQHAGKAKNARLWVYLGDDAHPYNLFDFTLDRGRDGPHRFLGDYRQVLLADAYGGYNELVAANGITRAGCWAHVRRKFVDAEPAAPEIARQAIALVRALYAVEKRGRDLAPAARLELRQTESVPLLAHMRERLLEWKSQLLPKHPMAEAVHYALGQWAELSVFAADATVPIDNNCSEREIKRVVLNRKNSLFVGNERGGRTMAILASLTSTCRRHGIDPQLYLTQLLVNLPAWPARDREAWLPDQWKAREAASLAAGPPAL